MTLKDAPGRSMICLFAQRRIGAVDVALEVWFVAACLAKWVFWSCQPQCTLITPVIQLMYNVFLKAD